MESATETASVADSIASRFIFKELHYEVSVGCLSHRRQAFQKNTAISLATQPAVANDQYTLVINIAYQATGTLFQGDDSLWQKQLHERVATQHTHLVAACDHHRIIGRRER